MPTMQGIDYGAKFWFERQWNPVTDIILTDVTALGGVPVLALISLIAFGLLLTLQRYRTAVYVLLAVAGGALLLDGIKMMVGRERPEITHPRIAIPPTTYSFPSGHATMSAVVYVTLALLVAPHLPQRKVRAYIIAVGFFLAFLIGVSRIYLGVHFASDVVAGWIGGLTWALACRWIEHHWQPLRQEEEESQAEASAAG